jgi:hypothetical protein
MKLVEIKNLEKCVLYYREWVYRISPKHGHLYADGSEPQKNRVYIAIANGYHFRNTDVSLTLIQDPITHEVYVVETSALIDLSKELEIEPQNSTIMGIVPVTIQEVVNILDKRIYEVEKDLSNQTCGSAKVYRAIEINLLERTIDSFTDKFNLTEIILYTTEDVQNLIDAITDEADDLAEALFDTMDLSEIESPIMEVFNEGE